MPTIAFTPHASNEIWCRSETTALQIKELRIVIGNPKFEDLIFPHNSKIITNKTPTMRLLRMQAMKYGAG